MRFNPLFIVLLTTNLFASPWGKDADLASPKIKTVDLPPHNNLAVKISQNFIKFHQEVISPADGPRSHFYPSSSQYGLDAISTHGFCKGWLLALDRLMRENDEDWIYKKVVGPEGFPLKHDPVK